MIIEIITIAIIFIVVLAILKKLMYIGFKVFGIALAILIIMALTGFIL